MTQAMGTMGLKPAGFGDSGVISELLGNALRLFEGDHASARRLVEQAFTLADLSTHPTPLAQGALASWQVRRVESYIGQNLGGRMRIEAAASLISLSPSYFSRAFKTTFGSTFSRYVMQRRIALAKQMLLTTDASIAEVALDCGLSDQAHLTRLFTRSIGAPPNAWRRAARCAAWPGEAAMGAASC